MNNFPFHYITYVYIKFHGGKKYLLVIYISINKYWPFNKTNQDFPIIKNFQSKHYNKNLPLNESAQMAPKLKISPAVHKS